MSEEKSTLESIISHLKQQRDELNLQMHLAEMDAKDEFEKLSDKFDQLTSQYDPVKHAVAESTENVVSAMELTANEIKDGFVKVWESLKKSE